MFNHESPLRPEQFVTQKIIRTLLEISNGNSDHLTLGNIDIYRDWGWAPEYVQAMCLVNWQTEPDDFVIATGESHSLRFFVELACVALELDFEDCVSTDKAKFRPNDIRFSKGNPEKARSVLGWTATTKLGDLVQLLLDDYSYRARKN